jgi:hypothetical protein
MEIPAEALGAAGIAITAVVGALWWQLVDRVKKLEGALKTEQTFTRETLVGLVYDGTQAMTECGKCSRRHLRTVEILRERFGDDVLRETHAAMQKAENEQADTERHQRPTVRASLAHKGA